jgi:hypothetical protein
LPYNKEDLPSLKRIDLYLSSVPKATINVHLIFALSKYNICPTLFIVTTQIFKEHVEKKLPDKVSTFNKTIELLKITSTLLKNFKSKASYR